MKPGQGYAPIDMGGRVTELRLPADRDYIVVAKRSAAAVGSVAGFDMDAIDDLTIAVAQAVENAIGCLERSGVLTGQVRIAFKLGARGLEVNVRSTVSRDAEMEAQVRAQAERARTGTELQQVEGEAAVDLALRLMGLFVDDSSYRVDERTGGLRVRLTKYRVS
ncbi:MAG TPA: ATP-binding protein [Candidatus Acidoferrales bacterium]|nr:ATP-binding protein [Candidatus Acidoferrales bacterium]